MTGWQGYARAQRRERRLRCVLCAILGFIIGLVVFVAIPALAHIKIPSDVQDHMDNIGQCQYADGTTPGVVACSDPAADPCTRGQFCKDGFCHTHSQDNLGGKSAACIASETPPPPPVVVKPPVESCIDGWHRHPDAFEDRCHDEDFQHDHVGCTVGGQPGHMHDDFDCHVDTEGHSHDQPPPDEGHSDDHPRWGVHEADDHACSSCDDQNGTCGWWGGHRHPTMCPNIEIEEEEEEEEDDPPVVESCTCCKDVTVTRDPFRTCEQECASLIEQIPDACPVVVNPPKVVDPPVDPPADELEVCQHSSFHSHEDAFNGRCHSEEHQHGHIGCNFNGQPGGHRHDDLACHNAEDSHDQSEGGVDSGRGENRGSEGRQDDDPPVEACQHSAQHSHEDAFDGRCHANDFHHGAVGCGFLWHSHNGLDCHDPADDHDGCSDDNGHEDWTCPEKPPVVVTPPSTKPTVVTPRPTRSTTTTTTKAPLFVCYDGSVVAAKAACPEPMVDNVHVRIVPIHPRGSWE